jgi:hypothetical protein
MGHYKSLIHFVNFCFPPRRLPLSTHLGNIFVPHSHNDNVLRDNCPRSCSPFLCRSISLALGWRTCVRYAPSSSLPRFGRYLRVYSNRYSGPTGNVDGGSTTGGGGINLIKILAHNGMLRVASRPLFPPIETFFPQVVTLAQRRAATHRAERAGTDSRRYSLRAFIWFTLRSLRISVAVSRRIPAGLGSGHRARASKAGGSAGGAGYTGSSGKQTRLSLWTNFVCWFLVQYTPASQQF